MFTQVLTIARNTLTESIRQPIFIVLILLGGLLLGFTPTFAAYTLEHGRGDNKMLIDLSFGSIFLVGLLLASFTATSVLSKEIENKTVLTVISKPVARPMFVLGKFLGVFAAITLAHLILCVVFILTLRHGVMQTASDRFDLPVLIFGGLGAVAALGLSAWGNYYLSWPFNSTLVKALAVAGLVALGLVLVISPEWEIQSPTAEFYKHEGELGQIALGLLMLLQAVMILTAVAIACSTRLGQVMTLGACFAVQFLGLAADAASKAADKKVGLEVQASYFESFGQIFAAQADLGVKFVAVVMKIAYGIAPNFHFLFTADAITQGNAFDAPYVISVTGYSAVYTLAVLCVGVVLFQTREVS